jgi:hypothetical protein
MNNFCAVKPEKYFFQSNIFSNMKEDETGEPKGRW